MFLDTRLFAQENVAANPPIAAVEAVSDPHTRWLLNSQVGSFEGLGFKLPFAAFGTSLEKPLSRRIELQAGVMFSSTPKTITNDGHSLIASARAIIWLNDYIGLTGGTDYSRLWTSQFKKAAWAPSPGVVLRLRLLGNPTRMYLDYAVPNKNIDSHGVETSQLQGPEYSVESRVASVGPITFRFGLKLSAYRLLEQGNPQCDGTFGNAVTCPRIVRKAGTAALTMRYEWLKNGSNRLY
jgi:hypothetical protein